MSSHEELISEEVRETEKQKRATGWMQEEIMETQRGKEMAGKWYIIPERREAGREGGRLC